mgnify:CR=1 FL=1
MIKNKFRSFRNIIKGENRHRFWVLSKSGDPQWIVDHPLYSSEAFDFNFVTESSNKNYSEEKMKAVGLKTKRLKEIEVDRFVSSHLRGFTLLNIGPVLFNQLQQQKRNFAEVLILTVKEPRHPSQEGGVSIGNLGHLLNFWDLKRYSPPLETKDGRYMFYTFLRKGNFSGIEHLL